jgi:thiol-disulfide isomerase/thioredoxin
MMKLTKMFLCLWVVLNILSCSKSIEQPNASTEATLKTFDSWWSYNTNNVNLSANYTALDENSAVIDRERFLKSLGSGKYVAFKLVTPDSTLKYKLHKLDAHADKSIVSVIIQFADTHYQYFKMEGNSIPDFNFTDLNGKIYNSETTKGKIVVLKCWFIHCQVCVQEMPRLNEIVKKYQNRKDIVFLSLAYDNKDMLKQFLTKTKFDYAVSEAPQQYFDEKLKITGYPTHIIVSKKGVISKVTDNAEELIGALEDELLK